MQKFEMIHESYNRTKKNPLNIHQKQILPSSATLTKLPLHYRLVSVQLQFERHSLLFNSFNKTLKEKPDVTVMKHSQSFITTHRGIHQSHYQTDTENST